MTHLLQDEKTITKVEDRALQLSVIRPFGQYSPTKNRLSAEHQNDKIVLRFPPEFWLNVVSHTSSESIQEAKK